MTQSAQVGNLTAKVTKSHVTKTSTECTLDLEYPHVDVNGDATINSRIESALPSPGADAVCAEQDLAPTQQFTMDRSYEIATNARGILALTTRESSISKGDMVEYRSTTAYTFDLNTGRRLRLGNVLDANGIDAARIACTSQLAELIEQEEGADSEGSIAEEYCDGVQAWMDGILVEAEGLTLHLELPAYARAYSDQLIPWSKIASDLKPGVVADFVQR